MKNVHDVILTYASFVRVEKGENNEITKGVEEMDASCRQVHLPEPILKVDGIQWGGRGQKYSQVVWEGTASKLSKPCLKLGRTKPLNFGGGIRAALPYQ